MIAMARTSSKYKRQTRPVVIEGAPQQTCNYLTVIKMWCWAPDVCLAPRGTGLLTVGRNINLTLTFGFPRISCLFFHFPSFSFYFCLIEIKLFHILLVCIIFFIYIVYLYTAGYIQKHILYRRLKGFSRAVAIIRYFTFTSRL
jgi:hypothetical protein